MISNKLKILTVSIIITFSIYNNLWAQLKSLSNQADYIIITPVQFVNVLQPFVDWRQNKGLNISTVELQQIYSEFPDSTPSASIRDFVSYSLTYWDDPKPGYVLLVGGASLIPSIRVPSFFANQPEYHEDSVSVDEWYSVNLYETDTQPDVAMGRFPVNTEQELNNVISKTIFFEDSLLFNYYPESFLFLTDKKDSLEFQYFANRFIDRSLPLNFSYKTIFAGQDSSIEETREHLFNALNDGALFLSYYGHGAPSMWSIYNIFNFRDIDSLKMNDLPFIYTSAACSQSFDFPDSNSIVRKWFVQKRIGTVASVNSTGLTYLADASLFLEDFYSNFFSTPGMPIGEAVLQTKINREAFDHKVDAIPRRYTLLGDPAMILPLNTITQIVRKPESIPGSYYLYQNYPNPFNPSTTIRYTIPKAGHVTLKIYDLLGREIAILVDEEKQSGNYELKFNGADLSSGIYYYQMRCANFVDIKKFMLMK